MYQKFVFWLFFLTKSLYTEDSLIILAGLQLSLYIQQEVLDHNQICPPLPAAPLPAAGPHLSLGQLVSSLLINAIYSIYTSL